TLAVDALVVGQLATSNHGAMHGTALDAVYPQLDQAVIEQQDIAASAVLRQILVAKADTTLVTGVLIKAGIQGEAGTVTQRDAAIAETGDADLRALQVGKDGNTAPLLRRRGTNTCRHLAVSLSTTVGKVQPEH